MTRSQFSLAVNADEKWVDNSARLLGRTLRYDEAEARWLGLVRILVRDLGIPLARAAAISEKAMSLPPDARSVKLQKNESGSLRLVLDLARYHSTHAVSLSVALIHGERRKAGRPAGFTPASAASLTPTSWQSRAAVVRSAQQRVEIGGAGFGKLLAGLVLADVEFVVVGGLAAVAHGSATVPESLEICYERSGSNVSRLAKVLKKWKSYPRGVRAGLPFFMNKRQMRVTPVMTLTTRRGSIDLLDLVQGVGDYGECLKRSDAIEAFELPLRVLNLEALVESRRSGGRLKYREELPELERLMVKPDVGLVRS